MLFRILTTRQHKNVTFCDAYSFEHYRQQLLFYHDRLSCSQLATGCIVDIDFHPGKSNRGQDVFLVDEIHYLFTPTASISYKGFQQKEGDAPLLNELAQDINGGIHIRQYKFRLLFLQRLEELLLKNGIIKTNTPITMHHRGTSTATPVKAIGQYTGHRYIKITHELELKKQCYLSFAPLYEIGYIMRDRYETSKGMNEFLTLESVIPYSHSFDLGEFYLELLSTARTLAKELNVKYAPLFDDVSVIDVADVYAENQSVFSLESYIDCYENIIKTNHHCIVKNAPLDSPLGIANDNGLVMETKWLFNGYGFGHGYQDEYRANIIYEAFKNQQQDLLLKGVESNLPEDYLSVCALAGFPTFSFNLGIDRFLNCFFGEPL